MSKISSARPYALFGLLLWWAALSLSVQSSPVEAQELEQDQAVRLFQRLTGANPSASELEQMIQAIRSGNTDQAALIAINSSNLGFYKTTLPEMFSRLIDQEGSRPDDLNEFTATVVGIVVENQDFRDIFGDVIYTSGDAESTYYFMEDDDNDDTTPRVLAPINADGNPLIRRDNSLASLDADGNESADPKVRPLLRSNSDGTNVRFELNNGSYLHYNDLDRLSDWPLRLKRRTQTELYSVMRNSEKVPVEDIMGLMTLPSLGRTAFEAGTNRRAYKMIMKSFMCKEMEEIRDASAQDFRVRRDIPRAENYQTECRSCHANMDGLSGAFAFFDYRDGLLRYNANGLNGQPSSGDYANGQNQKKQWRQNDNYLPGHLIKNNSWFNFMTAGANVTFGWRTPASGQDLTQGVGARALGQVLANTEQFSNCMAEKAYERVCLDDLRLGSEDSDAEKDRKRVILQKLARIARDYESGVSEYEPYGASSEYNLKALFAKVSSTCFGGNQ